MLSHGRLQTRKHSLLLYLQILDLLPDLLDATSNLQVNTLLLLLGDDFLDLFMEELCLLKLLLPVPNQLSLLIVLSHPVDLLLVGQLLELSPLSFFLLPLLLKDKH
mmetsp:Transcript_7880/g.11074  ORF Transcript_7880/g.11074 Transcript_7880/m.11074 type:complete len:106 (+) Transcript_7880:192-509(+)